MEGLYGSKEARLIDFRQRRKRRFLEMIVSQHSTRS
eukprot:COSAG05_NODE_4835_length_1355_cov_1.724522_2_plen_35_part_01